MEGSIFGGNYGRGGDFCTLLGSGAVSGRVGMVCFKGIATDRATVDRPCMYFRTFSLIAQDFQFVQPPKLDLGPELSIQEI